MLRVSDQLLKIPGILLALAFGYLLFSLGRQTEDVREDDSAEEAGFGDDGEYFFEIQNRTVTEGDKRL